MNKEKLLNVALFQPGIPSYRLPIFKELSGLKNINLKFYFGKIPGPANVEPVGLKSIFIHIYVINIFGRSFFLSPQQLLISLSREHNILIFPWDLHYLFLVPSLFMARLLGKGTVLWGHGYSKNEKALSKFLRDCVGKLANSIVVYSQETKNSFLKQGWDSQRIFAAPNTLDQTEIQKVRKHWLNNAVSLKLFRKSNKLSPHNTILFCSRLETANRIDLLLNALKELFQKNKNIKLVIIGKGNSEEKLKKMARKLEIEKSIQFLGPIYNENNLAPWFLSASVFCYPSNIGLSLLHAFGYGLPVVTSNNLQVQNPEIVALKDGKNGFLFRENDIKDLSHKLLKVLNNPSLQNRLGKEARRTALEEYPVSAMVEGLKRAIIYAAKK